MKRRKWLTAVICSICLCCTLGAAIGVTAITTAKAETDEVVYDILDYSFSSAFLSTEGNAPSLRGAEIASGANVFSIGDATDYMQGNHGITFKAQAREQWADDKGIHVYFGGVDILFNAWGESGLVVYVDNNIGGWSRLNMHPKDPEDWSICGFRLESFDETQEHTYTVTRVAKESGHEINVYIDGTRLGYAVQDGYAPAQDGNAVQSPNAFFDDDHKGIFVKNNTGDNGSAVIFSSTYSSYADFAANYEEETATDIYDLTGNNAMKTAEGAKYAEWNFLRAENGKDIYGNTVLGDADGVTFKAKWNPGSGDDTYLRVYLGNTYVSIEKWTDMHIYISSVLDATGKEVWKSHGDTMVSLDVGEEHVYTFTRVKAKGSGRHLIRVYVDGSLKASAYSFAPMQKTGDWNYGCIRVENTRLWDNGQPGREDSTMTIKSTGTASQTPAFEAETNVKDLFEVSNDATILSSAGKSVQKGGYVTEMQWIPNEVNKTDGITFGMQTSATNAYDVVLVMLGSLDVRLNLHGGDIWFYVYNWDQKYGSGDQYGYRGSEFYTGKRIDGNKHNLKITRCKAVEGVGYNVTVYWDNEAVVDVYCPVGLENGFRGGSLGVQNKGADEGVTFFSTLAASEVLPEFEAEKCNDILYYGGDITNLLSADGKTMKNEEAILYSSDWMDDAIVKERLGTNGIEFKMKANADWDGGNDSYDRMRIVFGYTEIRFDVFNGILHAAIYNFGSVAPHEGLWGFRHCIGAIDETAEHTVKITRRLATNGKGLSVRIYFDNELRCETYEPCATAYSSTQSFYRMVAIRNQSGVDLTFKSGFDTSGWQYEEEVVNDLFAVKNQAGEVYNESALAGVNVPVCDRIINNVWDEEFASVSNGLEFKIKPATQGQSWKTSGNAKIYEACEEGTEGAVKGTDGKWYAPVQKAWSSGWVNGWNSLDNNNPDVWAFPAFYRDEQRRICDWATHTPLDAKNDLAFRYHLSVDWGTVRLQFKLTPEGQLVVRQFSRYSGAVAFEGVVMEDFDSSIEHTVKMARVREKTTGGFVTKLWIDDMQNPVMETYDPSPLGRSGDVFSHFLLDNLTGIDITVTNVRTLDDVKTDAKKLYERSESDYSPNYWAQVQEIVNAADAEMDTLESLSAIKKLAASTADRVDAVWTKEVEAQFITAKSDAESKLDGAVSGKNYNTTEQMTINELLAAGKAEIGAAVDFNQLETVTQIWLEKLGAVKTTEQLAAIAQARETAIGLLNGYFAQFAEADYSAENYAQIGALKETYASLIAAATEEDEIAALPLMAKTEMLAVKTLAQVSLDTAKSNFAAEIANYVNLEEYSADNRLLAESIIAEAQQKISTAASEEEIIEIVAAAKLQLDGLEKAPAPVPEASAFESWGWIVLVCVLAAAVAVAVPVTVVFVRKKKGQKDGE